MKNHNNQIWVDSSFKKMIKKKAIDADMNIISFTRKLAQDNEEEENYLNKKKKNVGFDFKF